MDWLWILCLVFVHQVISKPAGHMKPLGSHQKPDGGTFMIGKFPSPWMFYADFVREGRPVLMRNVLETGEIPAFDLWTDKYLREKFGNEEREVEYGKKENRKDKMENMTMTDFLNRYHKEDIYQVSDVTMAMKKDLNLPFSLQCGGFQNVLQMVVLWFSSGSTKSHLHRDLLDNINCLLDGKKEIIFIDKKHSDLIEANGWNVHEGYHSVNVEAVDMIKYPNFQKIPYYEVTMQKGDCLFIPYKWYHFVDSKPGRNMAVNFWFHHLPWFNNSDCDGFDSYHRSNLSLSSVEFAPREEEQRMLFLDTMKGLEAFYKRSFSDYMIENIPGLTKDDKDSLDKLFTSIDTDGNKVLGWSELLKMDIDMAIEKFPSFFQKVYIHVVGYDILSEEEEDSEDITQAEDKGHSDEEIHKSVDDLQKERLQWRADVDQTAKTADDLEKERLIKLADDGNLIMEGEQLNKKHEEL